MDFTELIKKRRSVRKYADRPVPEAVLRSILEDIRYAPSAKNLQPWFLYVVTDKTVIRGLRKAYDREWFCSAPAVIIGCVKYDEAWTSGYNGKNYGDVDFAIIFDHLTLLAAEKGLGTCWIGAFDPKALDQVFSFAPGLTPLAMTPVGYPADTEPAVRKRKSVADIAQYIGIEGRSAQNSFDITGE